MAVTGVIALDQMGVLIKISQGGQGIVYGAPGVRTSFAKSMVYKEYKKSTLASLDVQALRSMPDFLEALPYGDGAKLIGLAAWPCRVVEDRGAVTGFIMPAIPDEFFCEFWTSNASVPSKVLAEFQHLLNEPQIIAARFGGVGISDRQRYGLLGEFVSGLAFLHQRGVSVGDISPKNLLFSLDPAPAVYFIDCDAMRVNGVSLSDQVETPGWEVPAGEERATFHSDRYKLGLLALRLLVGDQGVRDSARLSSSVPQAIASVVRETLKSSPDRRPDLRVWKAAIDTAIGTASDHKPRVRGPQPPPPPPPPPPPRPSRPTPTPTPTPTPKSKVSWLLIPAALISLFAIVRLASGSGPPPSSAPEVTTPPAASSRPQTVTATVIATPDPIITSTTTQTVLAPSTRVAAPKPPIPSGDLGLSVPMSYPPCNGIGIVVVGNAVTPQRYKQDVARLLAQNPGAAYLRTDVSCKSLRQRSDEGNPIYAVYYIAGPEPRQVCALKNRIHKAGNTSAYGKWLYSADWSGSIEC